MSFFPNSAFAAATPCQAIYGGGEVCQGQNNIQTSYQSPTPTPTSNSNFVPSNNPTTLPSTGASSWSWMIIGLSGMSGVLLLLL